MALYFYSNGGGELGPVDGKELKRLVTSGSVTPKTMLRRDGQTDWMAAGKSKLFAQAKPDDDPEEEEDKTGGFAPFIAGAQSAMGVIKGLIPPKKELPAEPPKAPPPPVALKETPVIHQQPIPEVVAPAPAETKRTNCPFCGETILALATKCRHCGEFLDGRPRQAAPHTAIAASSASREEVDVWVGQPVMFRNSPITFLLAVLLVPVGLGVLYLFFWWLHCMGTSLKITNKRTLLRTGIFSKHVREVRHQDIRYLEANQGILNRIMGVGAISVSSAAQGSVEIEVHGIRDPFRVKETINGFRG